MSSHLGANPSDYYGKCEEEIFVENSVLSNLPPEKGTEDIGHYSVDYDVSYNKDGIVVLSKSFVIIDGIVCSHHQVDVLFSKPLAPGSLPLMFPKSAILVVDGNLFGTKCNFVPQDYGAPRQTYNVGFLVIETSEVDGSTVTITGTPTVFDAIFEEQSMEYRISSSRSMISIPDNEIEVKVPPKPPVQIVSKITTSASASLGNLKIKSKLIRFETSFLPYFLPDLTITVQVG